MPPEPDSLHEPPCAPDAAADPNYWHALINEKKAGDFLGLTDRTMQIMRQRGDCPPFIRISSRCLRWRRSDLRDWADARLRRSTSDPGAETA